MHKLEMKQHSSEAGAAEDMIQSFKIPIFNAPPNARINPAGSIVSSLQAPRMKSKLHRLGLNELLDFVRRDHSAVHHLSLLILPVNIPRAAWRFI
jgi:hypothetical protein